MGKALLEAKSLCKFFSVSKGVVFSKKIGDVRAVDNVSFQVNEGDIFGIVGESGCGKSTTMKTILLLEDITSGKLLFEGKDVSTFTKVDLRYYRKNVQAMLQDPYSSLSPRCRIKDIIAEPLQINTSLTKEEINKRVANNLAEVKLDPKSGELFPHEFSGGQRQRVALARAVAIEPKLVLLDEPVSALDVSVRAQLMNLLMDMHREYGLTYIIVAHDLAVVRYMCNRLMVMYLGKVIEYGDSEKIFENQLHPYTKALFSAALPNNPELCQDIEVIKGEIPSPLNPPSGCRFHPRCKYTEDICKQFAPELQSVGTDYRIACHCWREIAEKEYPEKLKNL